MRLIRVGYVAALLFALVSSSGIGRADGHAALKAPTVKPNLSGGTLLLGGTMSSSATISMTGAFSVGHAINLEWDLPLPTSLQLNGYTQTLSKPSFKFTVTPDSSRDLVDEYGHPIRRFHWDAPPAYTVIRVTETVHATVRTDLTPFHSSAGFPLASLPASVSPSLAMTPYLRLPASTSALIARLTRGKRTERAVVDSIADFVASTTHYNRARTPGPFEASWVLANHQAVCRGFDDLMAGLLRKAGIPAQIEYGWVTASPLQVPGPLHRPHTIQWSIPHTQGELHTWLNVYFPDAGWVPFDPQLEKFFVDPRHFGFLPNRDAGNLYLGSWTAQTVASESATGSKLANGAAEIVPGDGSYSNVSVQSTDSVYVSLRRIKHDVAGLFLLSR